MRRFQRAALFLSVFSASLSAGASFAASYDKDVPLDEVTVEGTRGDLNRMLQELVETEDKFFERYNELNTNDDFDMHCFRASSAGTKLKRRYCVVQYMRESLQEQGKEYAAFLKSNIDQSSAGRTTTAEGTDPPTARGGPPVSAQVMMEIRRAEYQQNMKDVVSRNPDLIAMLKERSDLEKRYEATRRKVWGSKPLPEEVEAAR